MEVTEYEYKRIHMYPTNEERIKCKEETGQPAENAEMAFLHYYEISGWRVSTSLGEYLILERVKKKVSQEGVVTNFDYYEDWDSSFRSEMLKERFPSFMLTEAVEALLKHGDKAKGYGIRSITSEKPWKP